MNIRILQNGFRKYILIVAAVVLLTLLLAQTASAAGNFYITNYDVEVSVREDDTYKVTEKIDVTFTKKSHGIYRKIPYQVDLDRDGQKSSFRVDIRDFEMISGQKYKDESDSEYFNERFGDPDIYEKEKTTYMFSYVYDMKGDHLKNADEFYYNLVGVDWEAQSIDHVDFKVHFPKPVDPEKAGVLASGKRVDFQFSDDAKTMTGSTSENVMKGLTARVVLPQGYYAKEAGRNDMPYYIMIGILFVIVLAGIAMWSKFGRDRRMVRTVEIEPPENLASETVGYLYAEQSENDHITSILLELANEGYVKIIQEDKKKFKIQCLKKYDGDSKYEKMFMDGLFKNYSRKEVTRAQLKNKFYKTVEKIKKEITADYEDDLYDQKAGKIAHILKLTGIIGFGLLFAATRILNGFSLLKGDLWFNLALLIVAPLLISSGFATLFSFINRRKVKRIVTGVLLIVAGLLTAWIYEAIPWEDNYFYMAGLLLCALVILLSEICEKKTDWYVEVLGKIYGYREFLKKTEKDRIERLVSEDPDYFYRNLSYAYSLDITDAYAKQFEGVVKEPPIWFQSRSYRNAAGVFSVMALHFALNEMMKNVDSAMTSQPGGSGKGGGSFSSGGGAGGGGGGSW